MMTWSHVRSRRADRMAGRRLASERGETLVEIMFTVVLLGTGFVAIMSAIFTSINVSDANQEKTKASIAVQAVAEALLQPADDPPASPPSTWFPQLAYRYVACATPADYQGYINAAIDALKGKDPRGYGTYTATIEQISYLDPATLTLPEFTATCVRVAETVTDQSGNPQTMFRDPGIQQIQVKIDSGARRKKSVDTLVFLKRDQRCPGTYQNADLGPC